MEDYEPIPISAVKPLKGDLSEREIVSEIDKMAVTLVDICERWLISRDSLLGQKKSGYATTTEYSNITRC